MTILLAISMVMIPPLFSGAELWCDSLGVDCEEIEQEQMAYRISPEAVMMNLVVACIQDGEGTEQEARECWIEVRDTLEEE